MLVNGAGRFPALPWAGALHGGEAAGSDLSAQEIEEGVVLMDMGRPPAGRFCNCGNGQGQAAQAALSGPLRPWLVSRSRTA